MCLSSNNDFQDHSMAPWRCHAVELLSLACSVRDMRSRSVKSKGRIFRTMGRAWSLMPQAFEKCCPTIKLASAVLTANNIQVHERKHSTVSAYIATWISLLLSRLTARPCSLRTTTRTGRNCPAKSSPRENDWGEQHHGERNLL